MQDSEVIAMKAMKAPAKKAAPKLAARRGFAIKFRETLDSVIYVTRLEALRAIPENCVSFSIVPAELREVE